MGARSSRVVAEDDKGGECVGFFSGRINTAKGDINSDLVILRSRDIELVYSRGARWLYKYDRAMR